jgi:uncharacterized protein (TIGR02594 family)
MASLPIKYQWLNNEGAPKILVEALKWYGTKEVLGKNNNPIILSAAKKLGISWYTEDSIPWCGLALGIWAFNAGYPHDKNQLLAAKSWLKWGVKVENGHEMLGDVLVFIRPEGGHVAIYVGEDKTAYHVLGGNQSDDTKFTRILKTRLIGARRSPFLKGQPLNIRKIFLSETGELSNDES